MKKKNVLIMVTAGEICKAIEEEMQRLGRNISNKEIQVLLYKLVKKKKAKFIGNTDMDGDLLTGNLREKGIRIQNLNEEYRRENNDKNS